MSLQEHADHGGLRRREARTPGGPELHPLPVPFARPALARPTCTVQGVRLGARQSGYESRGYESLWHPTPATENFFVNKNFPVQPRAQILPITLNPLPSSLKEIQ